MCSPSISGGVIAVGGSLLAGRVILPGNVVAIVVPSAAEETPLEL
jgi:hypothetical protein